MTLFERLETIYALGPGEGANRPGGSPEEDAAHRLVAGWMEEAGLEVEIDANRNLIGRLYGIDPSLPEVWSGSHLDSVPEGGCYDGALGVLTALEAAERVGRSRATLAVVAFRDEERGCVGSRAMVAARQPLPGTFVELHHEQGPRLAAAGAPIGVVESIAGHARGWRTFLGRASHAGTTPMELRDDAVVAAAQEVLRIRDLVDASPGGVATVGRFEVDPGAPNVIASRARLSIDVRAPDSELLDRLIAEIGVEEVDRVEPQQMDTGVRESLRSAAAELGVTPLDLPSGAGHDAGILAGAGVRAGMLFVRAGNDGASHSPREAAAEEDIRIGVVVLAGALAALSS